MSTLPVTRDRITGVLLAGGQSRRMFQASSGGGDKGLLDIAGLPMIGHVINRLAPQVARMVINANGDPARFAAFGLHIAADTIGDRVGPLAGILAGMRWSRVHAPDATHIATVSTDAPFVPLDLVARLASALAASGGAIALAASGGELHPVIGLWPTALADDLEAAIALGARKVVTWAERHGTTNVAFAFFDISGQNVDPFFNANTPDELADARALLAGLPPHSLQR